MDFDSWCLVVLAGSGPEREPLTGEKFDQARSWTHRRAATAKLWGNGNMGGVREVGATAAAVWVQLGR